MMRSFFIRFSPNLRGKTHFWADSARPPHHSTPLGIPPRESLLGTVGISPFFLMNLTRDSEVWAAVFFSDIIKDSDGLLSSRADLREDIRFAAYGETQPGMKNPPLGAMAVRSAEALCAASTRHEVFRKAWDALRSCAPDMKWVAIVDL